MGTARGGSGRAPVDLSSVTAVGWVVSEGTSSGQTSLAGVAAATATAVAGCGGVGEVAFFAAVSGCSEKHTYVDTRYSSSTCLRALLSGHK